MDREMTFVEKARRNQIIDIAVELIQKHGYRNTTIDRISQKAGVTKSVIYYHFGGKTELTEAILKTLVDDLFLHRKEQVDKQISYSDKLRAYIEADLVFFFDLDRKEKFLALFNAGFDLADKQGRNPWAPALNSRCFAFITEILRGGQAAGEFEFDSFSPEKFAPVIQGMLDGVFIQAYSDPEGVDWIECKKVIVDLIFSYVGSKTDKASSSTYKRMEK